MTGRPDLLRALGVLCEAPDPAHAPIAAALGLPAPPDAAACTDAFAFQLVPYAAPYLSVDGTLGGEAADRVAGFWRALRLVPPAEPDHLASLLGLYAALGEREHGEHRPRERAAYRDARRTLLWEHLLTWAPAYTHAMTGLGSGFHTAWARLLREVLLEEAQALEPPPGQPRHLRDVPDLPDSGSEAFVPGLLAAARSGLLITRRDLADAAAAMGLGTRIGGRAFIVRALISQDPPATFGWLAARARWWAGRHRADEPLLGGVARHWLSRANASLIALDQIFQDC